MKFTMKVREFIKLNTDIDVYDDVCEELGIAFCGPMALTPEGEEHFAEVLGYDVEMNVGADCYDCAVVKIDDDDDKVWKRRLRKAIEFFHAAAGYCDIDDYNKWFVELDFGKYCSDPDGMMYMTIYRDTTPWYTWEEIEQDNLTDMAFPRRMVQDYYVTTFGKSITSFVEWVTEICDADDTDGLFHYCQTRGFLGIRED